MGFGQTKQISPGICCGYGNCRHWSICQGRYKNGCYCFLYRKCGFSQGGILLQTPLFGPDNKIAYSVAQGPVSVGGMSAGNAGGANVQVNHPTVGIVSNGGIVEVEIQSKVLHGTSVDLLLRSPDSATAVKMADAINNLFPATSLAKDSGLVNVEVPVQYRGQIANFIAAIGTLMSNLMSLGVIINERTGTIVATQNVGISPVVVTVILPFSQSQQVLANFLFSGATTILEGENAE